MAKIISDIFKNRLRSANEISEFADNIIDTVREPLLALDQDLRVVKANRSFYDFFKVTPTETIGTLIYNLGNNQWDIPKLRKLLETILPEKTTFNNYEVEHDFTTIGKRIMLLNARQIERAAGKRKIILLTIEDITEKKFVEESFWETSRMTNEYLDNLFNHANVPIIIMDTSSAIIQINDSFEKLSGYTWDELSDKKIDILFPKNKIASTLELIKKTQSSEKPEVLEIDILTKGKDIRRVLWNSANIFDKEGKNILATIVYEVNKRKRAEVLLEESEERYRLLYEAITDGILITDTETKTFKYANPAMCRMLGYTEEELRMMSLMDIHPKQDSQRVNDEFEKLARGDKTLVSEIPCQRKDGIIFYADISAAITIVDGRPHLMGLFRDITERKQFEESLKEQKDEFETVFNLVPAQIWYKDTHNNFIRVNRQVCNDLGMSNDKIEGHSAEELFPSFAQQYFKDDLEVLNTRKPKLQITEQINTADGEIRWVLTDKIPVFGKKDDVIGLIAVVRDITERKQSEQALRNSEGRLRTLLQTIPDLIWLKDVNGVYLSCNKMFERFFGASEADIVGKTDYDFIGRELAESFLENDRKAMAAGKPTINEEWITFADDGHRAYLETIKTPMYNISGTLIGILGIGRDITKRKQAENELIEAKEKAESANKLKDAFIANISHEIRTPLTGILGMTSIIKETYQNNIKKEDEMLFEGIDISSDRIIRTIDMILNYSRLQVGEFNITPTKINLSLICTNLVKEFNTVAKHKSLDLTFQNNCRDIEVFADEYSITMAISNLLDNAIKYTSKGSVNVIYYKEKNGDLILDIKDTGIGIDKEYLDHLFEPYRQEEMGYGRTYEGIGLGLAIVKKIIDLNKAVISVESKKGEGTTFSINFGKGIQHSENKSKSMAAVNVLPVSEELRKEVVLLVEDDIINQVTIRRFIENKFIVIVTASSDEAMEIIKKVKVDIILMDISISGSMTGLELTKKLKESKEFSHLPIIAVTAHAFESDRKNSLEAGCNNYLSKPFTKQSLLNMIAGYTDKLKSGKGI